MFRKRRNIIYLILGLGVFSIVLNIIQSREMISIEFYQITLWYAGLLPTLITVGLGLVYLKKGASSLLGDILVCGFIGVGSATTIRYFYNNNIWFDAVITGTNTLTEYMFMVIILWIFIGLCIGIIRR